MIICRKQGESRHQRAQVAMSNGEPLNLEPILHRLFSKALAEDYYDAVFEEFCNELANAGLPLQGPASRSKEYQYRAEHADDALARAEKIQGIQADLI